MTPAALFSSADPAMALAVAVAPLLRFFTGAGDLVVPVLMVLTLRNCLGGEG